MSNIDEKLSSIPTSPLLAERMTKKQPSCENDPKIVGCSDDTISRQAALDAIHCDITVTGRQNAELVAETIGAFADRIKALPPVYVLEMNVGDIISRQAAMKMLMAQNVIMEGSEYHNGFNAGVNRAQEVIRNLPPVQPKRGKWIERNPLNSDKCRLIECDQCGKSYIVGFNVPYEHWTDNRNYCEKCGADMRGNEDGTD